ncbi:hypothetical protein IEQ34_010805 [Dendrobium chrysotoxum]|uniref:BHLH domain-containing protein n=1 Tax=Dendrobium chrysotoxum TaxID=161865 RepID=A0AAV7GX46_DENCH|nr:hypothetical protein IEQ34_010805 [Dendrobium chrysotoxum]
MMMVTEMADQKRRNHYDPFLPSAKRLKTGPSEDNASFSPKEKKDRIGERVAALQQLVSPFGKSDTASVLTEATAYINFLHDQLKVLSAPYLHSSGVISVFHGFDIVSVIKAYSVYLMAQHGEDFYSLKSRGLCLIPVAATVQIARSNGADIWAPITK